MDEKKMLKMALMVQDASNITAVIKVLNSIIEEIPFANRRDHPAVILIVDKLNDMVGRPTSDKYGEAYSHAKSVVGDLS